MTTTKTDLGSKIASFDLTRAKRRLQDPVLGKGWSLDKVEAVEQHYRDFLLMVATGHTSVPTKDVDEMWHLHILDTEAYAMDCLAAFGRFIHHRPYQTTTRDEAWCDSPCSGECRVS